MTYIRTDEIKKKQSDAMKQIHSNNPYDWNDVIQKRKCTHKKNGTKPGRKPGSGKQKTGSFLPCPVCSKPVYHQKKMIEKGRKKCCSRSCLMQNRDYLDKLRSVDRSYMQTEEYKSKLHSISTPEYRRYKNLVYKLSEKTYVENIDKINPDRHPRTLAGVEGGYQLDHIKTIKECFDEGISPEDASKLENLRMLPWKENVMRYWYSDNL